MNDFPNLEQYQYRINTQLGCNREGGRITWKGENLVTKETVIIKQFRFAIADSSWSGYKAHEQEIKILQQLDHPGIPKYLDGIETDNGFYLVQEYIPACCLNNYPLLSNVEVKKIVLELLDILIYLQQQKPPILHRDIKPENILLDDRLKVYLIDFGFASSGNEEVSGSSVFRGTPGFIAPEQIIKPTLASDLYSLGVTIVCLLLNKNISKIRDFVIPDNPYQLNLKSLLPQLDRPFLNWLEKMTNAKASKRFENALIAKNALLSVDLANSSKSKIAPNNNLNISQIATLKTIVGTSAVVGLSCAAVWGVNFVDCNIESTGVNIAIAILAGIVIGITELSAIEIAKIDPQARIQGTILGVGVPILLVIVSSFIWGMGEAVDIAATTVITQVFVLSYFWWQIPDLQQRNTKVRIGLLFTSIFAGISLGLQLV